MDEWVRAWLAGEREKGVKCLEIKYISGRPYVYHSTSRYDAKTKSPRKVSTYIGRLTEKEGLIPKGAKKRGGSVPVTWIVEPPAPAEPWEESYEEAEDIPPFAASLAPLIREGFPDCHFECISLLFQRIGLDPPQSIGAGSEEMAMPGYQDLPPETLLSLLSRIGSNAKGQEAVASALQSGLQLIAYPFSLAGLQPDPLHRQVALLLFGAGSSIPIMIRRLPGSGTDPAAIAALILSMESSMESPGGIILLINPEEMKQAGWVADTGAEPDPAPLQEAGVPFLYPLPHESSRYDIPIYLTDHFNRGDRLILYGSDESGGLMTYLYKDVRSATGEAEEIEARADQNLIDRPTRRRLLRRAGRSIILSSLREEPEVIFDHASSADHILPTIATIHELVQMDQALIGGREMDDDAISGSLFLSLLAANLMQRMESRNGMGGEAG